MEMHETGAHGRVWQAASGRRKFIRCAKCKVDFSHERSYAYCNPCKAEYMRGWRKSHPMTDKQRDKDRCRSYSWALLRRGKIVRGPCEHAGCENVAHMHHDDYSKPREVRWLCKAHHIDHHLAEKRFKCAPE